jgi:serine/threonine protein kinase
MMAAQLQAVEPEKRTRQVQLDRLTFEVIDEREGGFGKVWFLRRPTGASFEVVYGTTCAVKTFKAEEDDEQARIEQELGNWVSLHSPYIARLIKISRLNFELAALMEMMPGSLADYLRRHERLTEAQVKSVLLDVLRGLEYAYSEQRLVHLDLKPDNLLLVTADAPRVQITDWGISRIIHHHSRTHEDSNSYKTYNADEKTQFAGGTIAYMAPERFSDSWNIRPAADVFSLGTLALQLLTGQLPTTDGSGNPVRIIISHEYFNRAKRLLHNNAANLCSLVLHMLDPDPERRPEDYPTLIATLEKI